LKKWPYGRHPRLTETWWGGCEGWRRDRIKRLSQGGRGKTKPSGTGGAGRQSLRFHRMVQCTTGGLTTRKARKSYLKDTATKKEGQRTGGGTENWVSPPLPDTEWGGQRGIGQVVKLNLFGRSRTVGGRPVKAAGKEKKRPL